ncbi:MAG TPA: polysaccharide pyruvyl transferase family protein [Lachnospiraceae bacterium]|nr:polysaccharide pyruvyl transferase family protein [Lachnospiraceae bacterium]
MKRKNVKIVLFGLTLKSENKGCEALAYSFMKMLDTVLARLEIHANVSSVVYQPHHVKLDTDLSAYKNITHNFLPNRKKSVKCQWNILRAVYESDLCIDFTDGDSFSDLYGQARFFWRTLEKSVAILLGEKMMLGPQTYGPFGRSYVKRWAAWVIGRADYLYTRDLESSVIIEEMTKRRAVVVTDVAMGLESDVRELLNSDKEKIGINISGLLWNGGYQQSNDFGLVVDYKKYVADLIEYCMKRDNTEVYLIPHVITDIYDSVENDLKACEEIKSKFPQCQIINKYKIPMEIKGYIQQMDVFTGARMHATIAAFSKGVAVIPFAYSKKFFALYEALGYPYVIDGRKLTTDEALDFTIQYMNQRKCIREKVIKGNEIVQKKLHLFENELERIIKELTIG